MGGYRDAFGAEKEEKIILPKSEVLCHVYGMAKFLCIVAARAVLGGIASGMWVGGNDEGGEE